LVGAVIAMSPTSSLPRSSRLAFAWILQCAVLAVHIWDAAVHDFLGYYNATVLTLYGHFSYFPRLDWERRNWLEFPIALDLLLFALTPLVYRNLRWTRYLAYALSVAGFLVAIGQILLTIRGGTVPSVKFDGTSPGFYSSPILLFSSLYLLRNLQPTIRARQDHKE